MTFNEYTYCWNNPELYVDEDGEFPVTIAIGAVVGGAGSIISDVSKGKNIDLKKAGKNALKGAAAGASYRAGSDIITSIKNKEMTISSPNRYLTSTISGAMIYNSYRIAPKSAVLGVMVQGISDLIAGELSSLKSYAGVAVRTVLMTKYLKNPSEIMNLVGVGFGTAGTQVFEIIGGVQGLSVEKIVKETGISIIIALFAGQLGKINKLKEILGEDEWSAILDGLRRRLSSCEEE